ncbi:MAG: bifunctional diaminohydroxyphosphoribosylaminopyrimidine deaminase/5-amino-6-(5-phosphoribosylamino)uracil reductase RibD [Planctomycetota bacterium]
MTLNTLNREAIGSLLAQLGKEAAGYRFEVAPNPCVGAAVLSAGEVVATGFHREWGGPHAEVEALAAAAESGIPQSEWDTIVVTLEPCSTHGKTPACVDAILASGVRTVVVGALDPNPHHRGAGLRMLQEHGLTVHLLPGFADLDKISPHFLRWTAEERVRRARPWVIAKWAQTMTGQLSPPEDVGEGRWISSQESLDEVQRLRAKVDAIVTGVGTVLADDPRLTLRAPVSLANPPARYVLDAWLRTPPECRLLQPDRQGESGGPVTIFCLPGSNPIRWRALEAAGARVLPMRGEDRLHLRLLDVQAALWQDGHRRVLLETGPTLLRNYLESALVDQIRLITAPVRGGRGPSLADWLQEARLKQPRMGESGPDQVLDAFLTVEL